MDATQSYFELCFKLDRRFEKMGHIKDMHISYVNYLQL